MGWPRTAAIWLAFVAAMVGGASLLSARSEWALWAGLALLTVPVAVLAFLALAHYGAHRRRARQ